MFLCLVLSVLVPLVSSQVTPCCMASQWSAAMTDVLQFAKGTKIVSQFAYDSTNNAIAIRYFRMGDGQNGSLTPLNRIVTLYNQKVRYNIDTDNTCIKQNINETIMPRCIPGNAVYLGSSYVGTEETGLKYDGWQFPVGAVTLTMGISSPNCVPIIMGVVGSVTTGPVDLTYFFNQYTKGISPSAFKIPPSC